MQRKKIIIALAVLGCAAVLGVGGYGILSQTTDTSSKSATADGKDETDNQKKEEETTAQTDAAVEDTASIDGTTTDMAAADTTSANSSSSKSSGSSSKNSGNSSKSNSGNSSKSNSGSSSKSSSGNSSKPSSGGTSQSKPSQPAHTHSYSSSVTTQPTCSKAGVRTYTCSCGDLYTESIPATGNHKWEKQYKTEKVPAKTHQENVWKEICYGCGAQFDNPDDAGEHVAAVFGDACSSYYSDIVDTITVIDEPETTKDVYIGSKCSVCGAWQ